MALLCTVHYILQRLEHKIEDFGHTVLVSTRIGSVHSHIHTFNEGTDTLHILENSHRQS